MMYEKSLILYCMLPIIASSSTLWSNLTSDNEEKGYSTTVRYQLDANTMKNYDDGEDWYNLHKNFTKNNDDMEYRINFTNNNHERLMTDHFIQYKSRAHENDSQISVNSRINSTEFDSIRSFILQELNNLKRIKGNGYSTFYDSFNNFNRGNSKNNIISYKTCDDITCIRLCCPFDNPYRLVNRKCIPGPGYFDVLRNTNDYINDSFQNESEKVDNEFLFVVHVPCQKTGHYLINPYSIPTQNKFLVNGSLWLPYYNTIVEPTSYCLAVVDYNIFDVNVCFEIMRKITSKTTKNNKDIIYPINNTNKNLENTKSKIEYTSYGGKPLGYFKNFKYYKNSKYFENFNTVNNKSNIVSYKMCDNITCIRICCPFGSHLIKGKCIGQRGQSDFIFLRNMFEYINDLSRNESKKIDELFLLIVHDPCRKHYLLYPSKTFFANGSIYLSDYNTIIESTSYCFANVGGNIFTVNICWEIMEEIIKEESIEYKRSIQDAETYKIVNMCGVIGRILLSLVMFIVYSIVPELRNIQGFILRRYSGLVFIGEIITLIRQRIERNKIEDIICIANGFIIYYISLASFFWLDVMCFDMWRTFRQLRSLRNTKQQERKKLIMYSVFAWGGPFMLVIICSIMNFVPGVPSNIRPNFSESCWFDGKLAFILYYYTIGTISSISIFCLCISTAQKIAYYEKDIARHLKDSESRRYNDNKQWFKLCVQVTKVLFINYCIYWSLIAIEMLYDENAFFIQYTIYVTLECITHFCIMIIFLWKKRIWQLLLKRFGCQNRNMFPITQL